VIKVAVIGPESTGKSELCLELAEYYNTLWCPEFAREYLLLYGKKYTYDDLLKIAKRQIALEDEYVEKVRKSESPKVGKDAPDDLKTSGLLFIDTDMYVMKVWCEFVYGKCHRYILEQIAERKYDLYLLCNIDLPWMPDELREYPDFATRRKHYKMYKDILVNQQTPWFEISGNYEERLQNAVTAVNKFL
jgi:NadR type nicotinamide-nucleotide adenylyltransferase